MHRSIYHIKRALHVLANDFAAWNSQIAQYVEANPDSELSRELQARIEDQQDEYESGELPFEPNYALALYDVHNLVESDSEWRANKELARDVYNLMLNIGWLVQINPEERQTWWTSNGPKKEPVVRMNKQMYRNVGPEYDVLMPGDSTEEEE